MPPISGPQLIVGTRPDGSAIQVDLSAGTHVIWFLTSSCRPCREVWPTLGAGDVAVTPDAATESRRKVASLAPAGATVVMSSEAWFRFRPGPAPWRIVVRDGRVAEPGP